MSGRIVQRGLVVAALAVMASACETPAPRELSRGHLDERVPVEAPVIPAPVRLVPFVPPPVPRAAQETYTVVVNEVPVKELLFALARDASINADVHPSIEGFVTINAIDQPLDAVLDRVTRQLDIRYHRRDGVLVIEPDGPVLRSYRIDYVNVAARGPREQLHRDSGVGRGRGSGEPRQQLVHRHRQPVEPPVLGDDQRGGAGDRARRRRFRRGRGESEPRRTFRGHRAGTRLRRRCDSESRRRESYSYGRPSAGTARSGPTSMRCWPAPAAKCWSRRRSSRSS